MPDQDQYRKSPRANWISYNSGSFFVTVCTRDMKHYFGEIADGMMHLSVIGEFVHNELANVRQHHPHILIPLFVVMPNHFHAIMTINEPGSTHFTSSTVERYLQYLPHKQRPLLSSAVGSIKSAVTRFANQNHLEFGWQTRFHDHMIRDSRDGNNIADYIRHNVSNWMYDRFNECGGSLGG